MGNLEVEVEAGLAVPALDDLGLDLDLDFLGLVGVTSEDDDKEEEMEWVSSWCFRLRWRCGSGRRRLVVGRMGRVLVWVPCSFSCSNALEL